MNRELERQKLHCALVAFGDVGAHLRTGHGIEPAEDTRGRAAQHLEAHGIPLDEPARLYGQRIPRIGPWRARRLFG